MNVDKIQRTTTVKTRPVDLAGSQVTQADELLLDRIRQLEEQLKAKKSKEAISINFKRLWDNYIKPWWSVPVLGLCLLWAFGGWPTTRVYASTALTCQIGHVSPFAVYQEYTWGSDRRLTCTSASRLEHEIAKYKRTLSLGIVE